MSEEMKMIIALAKSMGLSICVKSDDGKLTPVKESDFDRSKRGEYNYETKRL